MFTQGHTLAGCHALAQRGHVTLLMTLALTLTGNTPVRADLSTPIASGAFIQLSGGSASRSASWWVDELTAMRDLAMDTLVVQYVGINNFYFYPTAVSGASPYPVDSIERILGAADALDMSVYLGLHLDTSINAGQFDLAANLARGQATLAELHTRYGAHDSLAGWYLPEEMSDYIAFHLPQLSDNILTYLGQMTDLAHETTSLPTMISPYFGQNPNAQAYANWWNTTGIPRTGVDILALQDGVGTHRTTIAQSRAVYEALAPVLAQHGVAFWANNESFNQIHGWPVDDQPWQAQPADAETFIAQIEASAPFVEKAITFEFTYYMSPQRGGLAAGLYSDYLDYVQSVLPPPPLVGDLNGDGVLNAFDVSAFELALADRAAYELLHPDLAPDLLGDLNGDGVLDAFDLAPFEALLASIPVPQPAAFIPLILAGLCLRVRPRVQELQPREALG